MHQLRLQRSPPPFAAAQRLLAQRGGPLTFHPMCSPGLFLPPSPRAPRPPSVPPVRIPPHLSIVTPLQPTRASLPRRPARASAS
ncbi:hypothetical protein JMJ77_0001155 [Colletotrichum scovillei]|uniref:Uncharacterized protein n=1 Tax=Colletotrichum scovillei TaxID=1209932 RepID=A0A9P7UEU7_9PEZI|nr:hypothetical protein JMJ77_0001155 [Colletotrichum scovillei]KAG7072380.1 hypothetical protein JMJ76_0005232 [Colletotrichum scovillei]KAG7080630.1 hypothetical protein JMJ78_0007717 [Colletotrichum scovillei]